jgi:glutathione S-transferase
LAGQKYEDCRYPIDTSFNKPEFDQIKDSLVENMERVPILETSDGFKLGQSTAIEKYLAKKFNFYGKTDEEAAKIDMICEHVRDIKQKYNDSKGVKTGEEATLAKADFIVNELPKWMKKLEKVVEGNTFSVGSQISLSDVLIQRFVQDYADDNAGFEKSIENCPKLKGIVAHIANAAKGWYESRPVTFL